MSAEGVASVRFGRLERRGVLLGLSGPCLAVLGAGVCVAVIAEYTAGAAGLLVSAPVWVLLVVLATVSVAGRPALSWVPLLADWTARRALGTTRHVRDLRRHDPPLTIAVPGVRRALSVTVDAGTGAALVADRTAGTVTAILAVRGSGFLLENEDRQAARVAAWGQLLASLAQTPDVVRVQVLHRTGPAKGAFLRRWWAEHTTSSSTSLPARVVADLLADAESSAVSVTCLLAVAMRMRGSRHERSTAALSAFGDAVTAAGLQIDGWVTPRTLGVLLRRAYDPATIAPDVPVTPTAEDPATHVGSPRSLGSMGVEEAWESLRTDTAVHATYWVAEWPRSEVGAAFLRPLLLAAGVHRTFTLIAEPQPATAALREIRRAKVELAADAAQRARIGRIEDESSRAEAHDVHRRERDLVAGHGDVCFTGLITVTAPDTDQLREACRATEAAAARAMCELRLLVGQQTLAHAAAMLPLARGVQ